MEGKAPSLWDGNRDAPKELRLPNVPSAEILKGATRETPPTDSAPTKYNFSKSLLSADAPEFIPANPTFYSNVPQSFNNSGSSVQSRLKKHKAPEPAPEMDDFVGTSDDIRLKHLIETLTKDPGQFSDLLDIFMDTLYPYFEDVAVLLRAAELLVTQAIEYPSFRYTAARLCCCIEQYCPEFRAGLHTTCVKELNNHTNKSGLVMFVAELFAQLHHENIYSEYLLKAYERLLDIGGNENIKSVCQALKLTGHPLEISNKNALDPVIAKLNKIKPQISGTLLNLVNAVVSLRSNQWGHSNTNSVSSSQENENTFWVENPCPPVFYNSDGIKFTSEESDFLAAHLNAGEEYYTSDLSDPDELCDPEPEMDEEIQAAFRDFVKQSKR